MRIKVALWIVLIVGLISSRPVTETLAQSSSRGRGSYSQPRRVAPPRIPQSRSTAPRATGSGLRPGQATGLLGTVRSVGQSARRLGTSGAARSYRPSTGLNPRLSAPVGASSFSVRGRGTAATGLNPRQSTVNRVVPGRRPGIARTTVSMQSDLDPETTMEIPTSGSPAQPPVLTKQSMRTWTDMTGFFQTEAKLLHHRAQTVWLRKADGGLARFSLKQLSLADQNYVMRSKAKTSLE